MKKIYWALLILALLVVVIAVTWFGYHWSQKYQEQLKKDNHNAVATQNNQALALMNSGRVKEANEMFAKAVDSAISEDDKRNIFVNAAIAYNTLGDEVNALKSHQQALVYAPVGSFDYYFILGEMAVLGKDIPTALDNFNEAYAINPKDHTLNNSLGLIYSGGSAGVDAYIDYSKAIKYLQESYNSWPSTVIAENLAWSYFSVKDADNAIKYLLLSDLNSKPYLYEYVGVCYISKKDFVNARKYLQKAVDSGVEIAPEAKAFLNTNLGK